VNSRKAPTTADLPYRRGVGAMLINPLGKVFVGRRAGPSYRNAWQMPQGAIDEGETPEDAVLRELAEETGTRKAKIVAETPDWLTYDLPPELIGVSWDGKYRGQTQKWFALRFSGSDSDFVLDNHRKPEFVDWRWVTMDELPVLIVPFKRRLYDDVIAAFRGVPERIAAAGKRR
jgi:putative (di)nucleoside polyphosphate hydrolase